MQNGHSTHPQVPTTAGAQGTERELTEAQKRLNGPRLAALDALLAGKKAVDAAELAGVCRETLWRWQQDPDFRRALLDGREVLLRETTTRLHSHGEWAVEQLVALSQDVKNPAYARVLAAKAVIDLTVKTAIADDHAARLGALEEELTRREEEEG